jgi:hypothetical protein
MKGGPILKNPYDARSNDPAKTFSFSNQKIQSCQDLV